MNCGKKHQDSPCEISSRADLWTPFVVAVAAGVFIALASSAMAQSTIVRASLTDGLPGTPVGLPPANQEVPSEDTWQRHAISRDGDLVVFVTRTSLAAQDTNSTADVYIRNIAVGTTTLVSLGTDGNAANATCYAPTISGDGQYVAFVSAASNLTSEATGGFRQVFVRKLPSGPTVLISKSGANAGDAHSALPALSNTGRYVSYESFATNLTADATGGFQHVFLHDRDTDNNTVFDQAGLTSTSLMSRAGTDAGGAVGNAGSGGSALSDNGRFVAFTSSAANLVSADTNGFEDVFVHDRTTSTTTRVSVGANGVESHGSSFGVTMSADGRYVGFFSSADNLLAPALPVPQVRQAYIRDRGAPGGGGEYNDAAAANPNRVVSINPATGQYGNNAVGLGDGRERVALSPTGRFAAFRANSTNFGAASGFARADIYVHDRDADNDSIFDESGAGQRATLRVSATLPISTPQGVDCAIPAVGGGANQYLIAYESLSDELNPGQQNATGTNVFRGECTTAEITTQPNTPVNLCSGETLTLSVAVTGSEPFTYQWKKGTTSLPNSNSPTYTKLGATTSDTGSYTCVITNACGTVTSAASVVTVSNAGINTQPQPPAQTKCPGSSVNWTVSATGATYQWRKDGSILANGPTGNGLTIANATSSNLQVSSLGPLDAGVYDCLVNTSCGSQTSVPVTLSIAQTPVVTSQPAGATVCIGQPFSIGIEATGPDLHFQWQKAQLSTPTSFTNVSGGTGAIYQKPSAASGDSGIYRCRVWSGPNCGPQFEVITQTATVTIAANPTISTQPLNQTACVGGSASFTVAANGPNLQFQWKRGGNNLVNGGSITGATSPTLTINPVAPNDAGANYQCSITGLCGSTNSNTVALAVNNPPAITAQPTDLSLSAGDAATFRVTASGSTPLLYQWRKNDSPIAGANQPNLIINPVTAADAGQYDVVVSNPCNSATSFKATLSVAGGGGGGGGGDDGGDGGGGGGGGTGGGTCGLFGAAAPEALLATLTLMMLARSRTRRRNRR